MFDHSFCWARHDELENVLKRYSDGGWGLVTTIFDDRCEIPFCLFFKRPKVHTSLPYVEPDPNQTGCGAV